jgi:hypothetical protein
MVSSIACIAPTISTPQPAAAAAPQKQRYPERALCSFVSILMTTSFWSEACVHARSRSLQNKLDATYASHTATVRQEHAALVAAVAANMLLQLFLIALLLASSQCVTMTRVRLPQVA